MILRGGSIVYPDRVEEGDILIKDGCMYPSSSPLSGEETCDISGCFVMPGFIDLHVHGGGGGDFLDGDEEHFRAALELHLSHGTTALCPTTLTSDLNELYRAFGIYRKIEGCCDTRLLGFHLEGPYVSPGQLGAQDPAYRHDPSDLSYIGILEKGRDIISIWTIAPELPGAEDLIYLLRENGIHVSLGHSDCTYEDVLKAERNGADMVTHLFSSMSTISRRDGVRVPGLLESALISDTLKIELIADGMHVPLPLIRLVLKCVPEDNLILVTDAMRGAGAEGGTSILGSLSRGQEVSIRGGVARMPDGISFAGSVATADRLLRTMLEAGASLPSAVKMLTLNPARALGRDDELGVISEGRAADLVIMDDSFTVRAVLVNGRTVYEL